MEAVVLHRVRFLDYFCPKQGQDFKPSLAPIYPNMGKVALPTAPGFSSCLTRSVKNGNHFSFSWLFSSAFRAFDFFITVRG